MDRRELLKKSALGIGITLTGPTITAILHSCSPATAPLNWDPRALTEDQIRTVGGMADTILPKTDTPGALDLMIERFVDIVINVSYQENEQKEFAEQLNAFMVDCKTKFDKDFQDCSDEQKNNMIAELENNSSRTTSQVWGKNVAKPSTLTFYRKLKSLILTGYYTSEEVGKNILSYDPVPGQQLGCIPLSDVGNSWTEG